MMMMIISKRKKNERKEKKKKEYCPIHVLDGFCLIRGELRKGVFCRTLKGIMTLKFRDQGKETEWVPLGSLYWENGPET